MSYNVLSIIDPTTIRAVAFANVTTLPEDMICEADIEYVISRYISPVMGSRLLCAVSSGEYSDLKRNYLDRAISFYVRYVSAYDSEQESARVLSRARHFLHTLSRYLESHEEQYREYDSSKNILKHCQIHGNMVQVL